MMRLADHGILIVLLILIAFFSVATWTEQTVDGQAGADLLASAILALPRHETMREANVVLLAGIGPEECAFIEQLRERLEVGGAVIVGYQNGGPAEALSLLRELDAKGATLDILAGSHKAAGWTFTSELGKRFPRWADVPFLQPPNQSWPSFLLRDNLRNIVSQIAVIAMVAIGMTLVIATGGIDLSVGGLMAFAAIATALLLRDFAGGREASVFAQIVCAGIAILACIGLGLMTGFLITKFQMPPFIASLGMMWVARGLAFKLSGGESINAIPESFTALGRGAALVGIPNVVLLVLLLHGLAYGLVKRTVLGRYILAVGSNSRAAFLSGVPIRRTVLFVYAMSAALAGLGGVVLTSQLQTGDPKFGPEYELYVITAVVVGGTTLRGGQARIFGTLLGALLISVVQVGMNLMHIDRFTQMIVLGIILLGAVLADRWKSHGKVTR